MKVEIVFLLMEVLTTVALESQPIDQSHVLSAKETVQSVDQEIPTARVLQLSERKDSSFRKEEHQPPEGLKGSYGYRDENGDLVVRFYAADDSGYRIVKEERYPSSHIGRDGYDNNKHRTNFYDPDHIRHRTYPRNYHNDFFSRNYRPSSKTYRNYDKQYPNIHKNTHGFDAYYPTHKFRARDNSQYPNSVYQYNENIRPSEFPEFHKHRNNFNHGHHYAFPTQFFSNNPQRQFFQNQHPVFSQTYDDFHRFKKQYSTS
ncbi:uncharacterized protein LOC143229026 isoform X2 [Tachypleus tridentatus]|uniref:uncharacterized protein LOC143229026 isoform X2 n=1 Tax=Tachypleus tridentatus TaxID=6853 RepID=UPI003FD2D122